MNDVLCYVALSLCQQRVFDTSSTYVRGEENLQVEAADITCRLHSSHLVDLQRIRGFLNGMRYINPRFTYLLTYSSCLTLCIDLSSASVCCRRAVGRQH